jgi:hypothetical protein
MTATVPMIASAQFRGSIGCSAETIDGLSSTMSLAELKCKCFDDCAAPLAAAPPDARRFRIYEGRDIEGNDLKSLKLANFPNCVDECKADKRCVALSFDKWNRVCFLKRSAGVLMRIEPSSIVAVISDASVEQSPEPITIEFYRNRTFVDPPYDAVPNMSFSKCSERCARDKKCEVFTLNRADARCNLIARPSEWFKSETSDCGVKRQRPNF